MQFSRDVVSAMFHSFLAERKRAKKADRAPSAAAMRNPRGPHQGRLSARPMVLTERTRVRGGARSRRRTARVWAPR